MPYAPPKECLSYPCPNDAVTDGRCAEHARGQERTRYNADTRKWYSTTAWQLLRALTLEKQPICVECSTNASTICDHITPHRGDYALFFNAANLQGMCKDCHGRKTARGE